MGGRRRVRWGAADSRLAASLGRIGRWPSGRRGSRTSLPAIRLEGRLGRDCRFLIGRGPTGWRCVRMGRLQIIRPHPTKFSRRRPNAAPGGVAGVRSGFPIGVPFVQQFNPFALPQSHLGNVRLHGFDARPDAAQRVIRRHRRDARFVGCLQLATFHEAETALRRPDGQPAVFLLAEDLDPVARRQAIRGVERESRPAAQFDACHRDGDLVGELRFRTAHGSHDRPGGDQK